ncbi:PAAR domain-containing protein [Enterobacter cloacae]
MVTQRTLAKLGNKTRYGHIVSASSTIFDEDHNPLVRAGDKAWCDVCKGAFEINATYTGLLEAVFIAGDGDLVLCHCKDNFVIAMSGFTGERHPGIMSAKSAVAAVPLVQQAQQEPEQHAQVAKKQNSFADTCKPEDNQLLNGVYIWTETTSAGHAFVSVHENNNIYLYTYGRYGRTDRSTLTGDGILDFFQDEDARKYYRYELYEMGARAFRIDDAAPELIRKYFEKLWNNGVSPIQTPKMQDGTIRRGRTIDKYDVTGNNCTTHSVEGIKFAGSKLFEHGYTSTTTQLPINIEEDFTIPVSLQSYLESKSADYSSMLVVEMTSTFKQQYPNIENKSPQPMGGNAKIQQVAADSAAVAGSTSPYSGGTVGGSLGSTYDDE